MGNNKGAAEMVDRKEGYYWVSFGRVFEIASWYNSSWWLFGYIEGLKDSDFKEIDERQICRS